MTEPWHLRRATPADAAAMVDVQHAAVDALRHADYPDALRRRWSPPPDDARRCWLADLVGRPHIVGCVGLARDGEIVGFGLLRSADAFIQAVYVRPDAQGAGLGRRLLAALEHEACEAGLTALSLNASLNAVDFYRRAGYLATGPTRQRLDDTVDMPAILMRRQIGAPAIGDRIRDGGPPPLSR